MSQPYDRVFNFSPGPCTLAVEVLEEAREGLLNWRGVGMSVMEMSHRGKAFEGILAEAAADLKTLMGAGDDYVAMFLQGGASLQNTMIPMNLLGDGRVADYVVTGSWGKKSEEAAHFVGKVNKVYDGKSNNYSELPDLKALPYSRDPAYIHFTSNETIQGIEFKNDPDLPPLAVCDMSSDILSRPMDATKYGLVYAGAQKNQGPAGVTTVLIRKDVLESCPDEMHPMLSYKVHASNDSMYNTPPTWNIYVCGLTYKWVLKKGGLGAIHEENKAKAQVIYDAIDASGGFYTGHVKRPEERSIMNVTFTLPSEELTNQFVKEAAAEKLDGLKGHRSVGGCRASIYNAFPREGCELLASFMKEFASKNG